METLTGGNRERVGSFLYLNRECFRIVLIEGKPQMCSVSNDNIKRVFFWKYYRLIARAF